MFILNKAKEKSFTAAVKTILDFVIKDAKFELLEQIKAETVSLPLVLK